MITEDTITRLAKKYKTNESVVFREYLQLLWLSKLYTRKEAREVTFKGGTAIHLIFKAPRFSEDLDFTANLANASLTSLIKKVFGEILLEAKVELKEKKTVAGRRFLLTSLPWILPFKTFVNLDFSLREKIFNPQKSIITTPYPVLFTSYVYHLSKEEMLAEKIRAILTRKKGRDLYDLWYLISSGTYIEDKLVREKLNYYKLEKTQVGDILKKIEEFSKEEFILDIRPFVPINERAKLAEFFYYLKDFLKQKLSSKV